MLGGCATLLLWTLTRADFLMLVGLALLVTGPVFVLVGLHSVRHDQVTPRPRLWAMAVLLLANFPIAGAVVYAATAFYGSFTTQIVNHSNQPIHDIYVVAGDDTAQKSRLDPGESFHVRLYPNGNTVPFVSFRDSSGERSMSIDHYLTGVDDGHMTISVLDDECEVEIRPIALRLFESP